MQERRADKTLINGKFLGRLRASKETTDMFTLTGMWVMSESDFVNGSVKHGGKDDKNPHYRKEFQRRSRRTMGDSAVQAMNIVTPPGYKN